MSGIYAVYPDADATERCCNAIADSADLAVTMVSETGLFPMTDAAHAVPVDESCLTRIIVLPVEESMFPKNVLRRILSYFNIGYYASVGRAIRFVDAYSWRRTKMKISLATIRYEVDRFILRERRRTLLLLRAMARSAYAAQPIFSEPVSQYTGETEEPEGEV